MKEINSPGASFWSTRNVTLAKTVVIVLAIIMALMLTSCGHKDAEKPVEPSPTYTPVSTATPSPTPTPTATPEPTATPKPTPTPVPTPLSRDEAQLLCKHRYRATVVRPSCTDIGYTEYECPLCGDTYHDHIVGTAGHDYTETVVPASATDYGYTLHTCSRCGETFRDNFTEPTSSSAHFHKWEVVETVAATCTNQGYTTYRCPADGETKRDDYVYPTGHNYVRIETHPVTCLERGYNVYQCTNCGNTYESDIVNPVGHTYVDSVVPATCTENGYTTHTCSVCGYNYSDSITQATGHKFALTKTESPTCYAAGYDLYTCSACGLTEQRNAVEALGHNWEFSSSVEATCTAGGYDVYVCSRCGATNTEAKTSALGHARTISQKAATCTDDGYYTVTCSRCGATISDTKLPALGHDMVLQTHVDNTCSSGGYEIYKCSRCGYEEQRNVRDPDPALHQPSEWKEVKATCVAEGYRERTCTVCGQIIDHIVTEQPTGIHTYQQKDHADATCVEDGFTSYVCTVCGDDSRVDVIKATGHVWKTSMPRWANNYTQFFVDLDCENCDASEKDYAGDVSYAYHAGVDGQPGWTIYTAYITKDVGVEGLPPFTLSFSERVSDDPQTPVKPHEHKYSAENVSFEWTDVTSCQATFTCTICGGEPIVVDCEISGPVHTDATCGSDAADTYTATATIGEGDERITTTDTKDVTSPGTAPGYHNWGTSQDGPEYAVAVKFDQETLKFTFTGKCLNCGETQVIGVVDAVLDTDKSTGPTCFETGKSYYSAELNLTFPIDKNGSQKTIKAKASGGPYEIPKLEHTGSEQIIKAPGCLTQGLKSFTCDRPCCAGKEQQTPIPALGHNYRVPEPSEFEWSEDMLTCTLTLHCTNVGCPEPTKQVECSVTHEAGRYVDCETPVTDKYTATARVEYTVEGGDRKVDEFTNTRTKTASGHKLVEQGKIWAEDFSSLYLSFYCEREGCQYNQSTGKLLEITTYDIDEVVVVEGDCTTPRQVRYTANVSVGGSNMQYNALKTTPAEGHDFHEESSTPPSCTAPGNSHQVCSKCGATEDRPIPATKHSWDATEEDFVWSEDYTTCTVTAHCSVCSETKTAQAKVSYRVVDETGAMEYTAEATFDSTVFTETVQFPRGTNPGAGASVVANVVVTAEPEATEEPVVADAVDTVASDSAAELTSDAVEPTADPAADESQESVHGEPDPNAWEVTKEPTCTEDGEESQPCPDGCGEYLTRAIPATGHKTSDDAWEDSVAATCTEAGVQTQACQNGCGETLTRETAPLGHDFSAGDTCLRCGAGEDPAA